MTAQLVIPRAVDGNDDPVSGALLIIYNEGTSTPQATYTDSGLGTPNSNPLVADGNGDFTPVWITESTARAVIRNAADTLTLWEKDPCPAGSGTADNATEVPFTPITGNGADDVAEAIGNNTGSILTLEEAVENATRIVTTAGSGSAYTVASVNPVSAYATGQMWLVQFHTATSSNCTLSIDGLPAQALKRYDSASKINMAGGTLQNNSVSRVIYDGVDLVALDSTATDTHPGLVELVYPGTINSASPQQGRVPSEAAMWAAIDERMSNYKSTTPTAGSSGGTISEAHGLGEAPSAAWAVAECTTADGSFEVGDRIHFRTNNNDGTGVLVTSDATNVNLIISNLGISVIQEDGTGEDILTPSRWDFTLYASVIS